MVLMDVLLNLLTLFADTSISCAFQAEFTCHLRH